MYASSSAVSPAFSFFLTEVKYEHSIPSFSLTALHCASPFSPSYMQHRNAEILFCDSQEAVFPLTAAGYCFTLLPDYPGTRQPELRYLPISETAPLSFGAVYFPETCGPFVRPFVELLRSCAGEEAQAAKAEKKD